MVRNRRLDRQKPWSATAATPVDPAVPPPNGLRNSFTGCSQHLRQRAYVRFSSYNRSNPIKLSTSDFIIFYWMWTDCQNTKILVEDRDPYLFVI